MLIWRTIKRTIALTQRLTERRGKHYKTDNKQGLRRVQRAGAVEDPSPQRPSPITVPTEFTSN